MMWLQEPDLTLINFFTLSQTLQAQTYHKHKVAPAVDEFKPVVELLKTNVNMQLSGARPGQSFPNFHR